MYLNQLFQCRRGSKSNSEAFLLEQAGKIGQNHLHWEYANYFDLSVQPLAPPPVIKHFDHVTVCVQDLEGAKRFFGLLGFEVHKSGVISGEPFAGYMGLNAIEARSLAVAFRRLTRL